MRVRSSRIASRSAARHLRLAVTSARLADGVALTRKPRHAATVLVVAHDPERRERLRAILSGGGYEALAAASADEAVEYASRQRFDLLLTDVLMPRMLGKELTGRVVAVLPHVKVLYMSGHSPGVLASLGAIAEGVAFIEAPFTDAELLARIREVLRARSR